MVFRRLSLVFGLAVIVSSCGGIIDPAKNTIEQFSGSLSVGGSSSFTFSWGKNGEIEVTITMVSPTPANGPIWIQLGQVTSGSCALLAGYSAQGIVNRKVQFGVLNKGTYCLLFYDPGVLTVPVNFAGNFSHP
jgi:hypothetical protein